MVYSQTPLGNAELGAVTKKVRNEILLGKNIFV